MRGAGVCVCVCVRVCVYVYVLGMYPESEYVIRESANNAMEKEISSI